ncbi:hypothetical protein PGTUg99_012493 [Puccinia graminis f. sp. tritici]|uniref:Uncharacterized protein n=1 Tax=Puccinia graminis f. sp. tritici TaxID=56615 RepID=A0A5B0SGG6_PUCGR|nr:hypothetical protein PGTUg99_012493 [Puccinia graminis f. sp. tritici]
MEGKPRYSIWTAAFGEGFGTGTGSLAQPRELKVCWCARSASVCGPSPLSGVSI